MARPPLLPRRHPPRARADEKGRGDAGRVFRRFKGCTYHLRHSSDRFGLSMTLFFFGPFFLFFPFPFLFPFPYIFLSLSSCQQSFPHFPHMLDSFPFHVDFHAHRREFHVSASSHSAQRRGPKRERQPLSSPKPWRDPGRQTAKPPRGSQRRGLPCQPPPSWPTRPDRPATASGPRPSCRP